MGVSWDPLGLWQPCPHHSQQPIWGLHPPSGASCPMVSLGGAQGGGTGRAGGTFPSKFGASQQPRPPPRPQTPTPVQREGYPPSVGWMQLARHPWVLPPTSGGQSSRQRDLRGRRSCPGRGGGHSAGSPPGSRPAPGRRGRAAAGPRAQPSWRHRQRLRRGREKTRQTGTAPAPPSPAPAPKCARSQPVLPQPPHPPRHVYSQSPCQNYPFGKGARLPPHPQNRPGVSRLNFFQATSWHTSRPGLILAGGRGGAARPRLSPEQDAPYPSNAGTGRGCPAPVSTPGHFWGAATPVPALGGFSHRCWQRLRPPGAEQQSQFPKNPPVSHLALPTLVAGGD